LADRDLCDMALGLAAGLGSNRSDLIGDAPDVAVASALRIGISPRGTADAWGRMTTSSGGSGW
jgi:hypothetical protein